MDGPVHRAHRAQREGLRRGRAARARRRRDRLLANVERHALAVVHVAGRVEARRRAVGVAELLGEGVDRVAVRRRAGPREVLAVPDQRIGAGARERHAGHIDAAAVQLVLEEDLGRVVADLRAHRRDRPPVGAVRGVDDQRVGGVTRQQVEAPQPLRPRRERGVGARSPRCRRRASYHGVALDHRPGVGHRRRRALPTGPVAREALGHDRRGLGVLGLAEVVVDRSPLAPEPRLEVRHQLGGVQLATAVGGELGDQVQRLLKAVGQPPGRRAEPERRVLGGQLRRIVPGRVDIGVDAVDVVEVVLAGLHALGPHRLRQRVELVDQFLVGDVLVAELVGVRADRRRAEELGTAPLGDAPDRVHQEQPVLGGRVARTEHHVRARVAIDARHAEAGVAHDRHAGPRHLGPAPVVLPGRAERGVLPVVGERADRQRVRPARDPAVHVELVDERGRRRAGQLVLGEVDRVDRLALPHPEHRVEAARVAIRVGVRGRRERRRGGDREHEQPAHARQPR